MWPREHGAYVQLGAPLLAASVAGTPTAAVGCLVLAAVLAFLAYEPLLIAVGRRGKRALEQRGAKARRRAAGLVLGAVVAGGVGLAIAPVASTWFAVAVAVPTLALLAMASRRAERSVPGEIVAAIALSGAAAPVSVAAGASLTEVAVSWAGWSVGLAATVVAVHRVLARHRHAASAVDRWTAVGLIAAAVALVAVALLALPSLAIAVPLVIAGSALVIRPPRATRMRAVGFALLAASLLAATLQVALATS